MNNMIASAESSSKALNKIKNMFKKYALDLMDSVMNDDGSVTHKLSFMYTQDNGEDIEVEFYVNGKPADEKKEYVDLSFKYPDPDDPTSKNYLEEIDAFKKTKNTQDNIVEKCQKFIKDKYDVDTLELLPEDLTANHSIVSTKSMKLTLQKIQSTIGYDIELQHIQASYLPSDVLADVNTLVADDSFVDEIPFEGPVTYDIVVTDNDIAISDSIVEDFDQYALECKQNSYDNILSAAWLWYLDAKACMYTACGCQLDVIQRYASQYSWQANDIIDVVSKMGLELGEGLEFLHPISIVTKLAYRGALDRPGCTQLTYWDEFIEKMKDDIQVLIDTLELYSCNLEKDKEIQLQNYIRMLNYELNYNLARSTM